MRCCMYYGHALDSLLPLPESEWIYMKLRLFAIRDLQTGRLIPNLYFGDKLEAKKKRDALGKNTHCVTYGPDHRHYKTPH